MNFKLVNMLSICCEARAQYAHVSKGERSGAKLRRESFVNKNSKVAPRFKLVPPSLLTHPLKAEDEVLAYLSMASNAASFLVLIFFPSLIDGCSYALDTTGCFGGGSFISLLMIALAVLYE